MISSTNAAARSGPDELDRGLLDGFQRDFPLDPRPFAILGEALELDESEVIERLATLKADGAVSRVGAVLAPNRVGASTLAALAAPAERLEEVAVLVNAFREVNHNYEREHRFNLWFVVTAPTQARVDAVLAEIEARTGLRVLDLPLLEAFHIDLGFPLRWS
jgi:siroheme decarboxylase